jgi:uncharacterized protein YjbJ (UPF0337 family)
MNRDTAAGNWQQLSGKIKQKWGKLTDNDLTRAEGDKEYLVGKLHEQYGLARDKAEDELDSLGYRRGEGSGGRLNSAGQGGNLDRESGGLTGQSGGGTRSGSDSREQGGRVSEGNATKRAGSGESVDEDIRAAGYGEQDQQEANQAGDRGSSRQLEAQGRNSRGQFTESQEGDAAMEAAGTSRQRQGKQTTGGSGSSSSPRGSATDKEAQQRGGQNSRGGQGSNRS